MSSSTMRAFSFCSTEHSCSGGRSHAGPRHTTVSEFHLSRYGSTALPRCQGSLSPVILTLLARCESAGRWGERWYRPCKADGSASGKSSYSEQPTFLKGGSPVAYGARLGGPHATFGWVGCSVGFGQALVIRSGCRTFHTQTQQRAFQP